MAFIRMNESDLDKVTVKYANGRPIYRCTCCGVITSNPDIDAAGTCKGCIRADEEDNRRYNRSLS